MEMVFLWISVSKAQDLCFYISISPLLILLLNTAIPLQSLSLPPASSSHSHEGFSSLNCPEQQRRAEGGWRFHLGGSKGCQGTLGKSAPWCGTGGGSCSFACAQWICLYSRVLELSRLTEISWSVVKAFFAELGSDPEQVPNPWETGCACPENLGFHFQRHSKTVPKGKYFISS